MVEYPKAAAVIFVGNLPRVCDFYCHITGGVVTTRDSEHAVLSWPGFDLVIHRIPNEPGTDSSNPPSVREDSYIKVCLPVESIEASRGQASLYGGHVKDRAFEWEARGFRACDGYDPEGNVFQLREIGLQR